MVMVTVIISCIPARSRCWTQHFLCVMVSQNAHNPPPSLGSDYYDSHVIDVKTRAQRVIY